MLTLQKQWFSARLMLLFIFRFRIKIDSVEFFVVCFKMFPFKQDLKRILIKNTHVYLLIRSSQLIEILPLMIDTYHKSAISVTTRVASEQFI